MSRAPAVDFRPYEPAFAADPYEVYARLRASSPVFRSEHLRGLTLFARYADVRSLVLDTRLGRSMDHVDTAEVVERRRREQGWDRLPCFSRYVRVNLLETEGSDHARVRRLVAAAFGPRRIQDLRDAIRACIEALLERRLQDRRMEFIADLAEPLPVHVIAELLGWPERERHRLRPWSAAIVRVYEPGCSAAEEVQAERAAAEFTSMIIELARRRGAEPRADLLSDLVAVRDQGDQLSEDELVSTVMLLLNAGHEATVNAAGNGLWALLRHPVQLERLRADPALLPSAVEEMLRYDAPLHLFQRHVLEDLEYAGIELRRGERVGLLYGSANRDSEAFERADEFDVARTPNRHLAFGAGVHFCLGAPLARLELQQLFETLLARLPGVRLAGEPPRYRPGLVFHGLESLQVRW